MKAPDKIYLNTAKEYPEPNLCSTTWDTKPWDDCINTEYIRKDALLEKLNAAYKVACKNVYDGPDAIKNLIESL